MCVCVVMNRQVNCTDSYLKKADRMQALNISNHYELTPLTVPCLLYPDPEQSKAARSGVQGYRIRSVVILGAPHPAGILAGETM